VLPPDLQETDYAVYNVAQETWADIGPHRAERQTVEELPERVLHVGRGEDILDGSGPSDGPSGAEYSVTNNDAGSLNKHDTEQYPLKTVLSDWCCWVCCADLASTHKKTHDSSMELLELYQLTGRLRRQFPRVQDVLDVCDELERLLRVTAKPVNKAGKLSVTAPIVTPVNATKRNMTEYMREYRKRKRLAGG
jgi:hypothetical protein